MPRYACVLEVEDCEGVAKIAPSADRHWALKLQCASCREVSPKFLFVDEGDMQESAGGGTRNAVFRCPFCKESVTVDVVMGSRGCADAADAKASNVIVQLDVRGGEPVELELDDQWVVESATGKVFEGVDLSEDWCEYDEEAGAAVSVTGVSISFTRAKK